MQPSDIGQLAQATAVAVSPTGSQVVVTVKGIDLAANRYRTGLWLGSGAGPLEPVTAAERADILARWSPAGRLVAYVSEREHTRAVMVMAVPGGQPRLVLERPDDVLDLGWSPDGTHLAVLAREPDAERYGPPGSPPRAADLPPRRVRTLLTTMNGDGWVADRPPKLFVVAVDGSGPPRVLTPWPTAVTAMSWSPGGDRVVVSSARHPGWDLDLCNDLWLVDALGDEQSQRLTDTSSEYSQPSWSPDGRWIAYLRLPTPLSEPRHTRLAVYDTATGTHRDLSGSLDRNVAGVRPVWTAARVVALVEDHGAGHLYRFDPTGSAAPELVLGGERVISAFDSDPEGRCLAYVSSTPTEPPEAWVVAPGEGGHRRLTGLSRSLLDHVTLAEPERFSARSADGTEVECWAIAPVDAGQVGKEELGNGLPTLLNVHGGPFSHYGYGFFDEFQLQAGAGFGVIYCNPRGSSGYSEAWGRAVRWPEADEDPGSGWGGVDHDDVLACAAEASRRFGWVDADRMGVLGGSYGGYMTSWIIGHGGPFVAGCSERAANDLLSLERNSDIAGAFRGYVGHDHVHRPDLFIRQSPITYVTDMVAPLLLLHSEDDLRCPIDQAEGLFVSLRLLGRQPELVRFPGETHELSRSGSPRHRIARAEIILEWFRRHLDTVRP
jgi:dipeptidyl aminopeptidase/acylaminoacyl peptidase